VGVLPNVELAQEAGIEVDNGIIVDEFCRTNDPNIVAAGDCANHFNSIYGVECVWSPCLMPVSRVKQRQQPSVD
jgi:NAD(P)H-nitrite reductase large subunit